MARSKDLQPTTEDPEQDLLDEILAQPSEDPPPIHKPQVIPASHFAEKLNAQQTVARVYLKTISDIIESYPAYRMSYSDCQFIQATLYGISVRHQLSPGQIKSLETLAKKAAKARGDA